ncbi:MAG TPA: prepilin-type cleavage/methylation domain-containing protein [Opitutae bacterium]|nr:prepilin-type cleavage/methylation domain-containing protein [Coraliomargarita sp.]HBO57969.1 prepilin-type cleavage/methylation domain-containing protein [Opitutae bacterium]
MQTDRKHAFTLIELLMVIAIIGILAGILIPTVSAVKRQANVAASKSQLSQYVNAIQLFKGEYGYYPFADAHVDSGKNINSLSDDFIETLSGRGATDGVSTSVGGNRREITFHSFSEAEFYLQSNGTVDPTKIADRLNNMKIFIVIDGDGDGKVTVPSASGGQGTQELRTSVTAYVEADSEYGYPDYYLYD